MDKTTPTRLPIWIKLCLGAGLLCVGQFFIFSLFGVIRGYSVQSWMPYSVMMIGLFILILFSGSKQLSRLSYLISFCIILFCITSILQGRYRTRGDELYKQKTYPAAITMYQKEINTWYLQLSYNHNEDMSLFGIAQSYCQLEDFEQAHQIYHRLVKMARGYYQERAQNELTELDKELVKIAAFKNQLANTTDDDQKADILFDMASAYRSIECAKKAREQYDLIQALNICESTKERAGRYATEEQL